MNSVNFIKYLRKNIVKCEIVHEKYLYQFKNVLQILIKVLNFC